MKPNSSQLKAMLREIVESWGTLDYWSCSEGERDCEFRDPHEDNEGKRCELHDMMVRAQEMVKK